MKTKIIYVIVSDESNYYLEQALLSIYSLKLHNPNAHVMIVADKESAKYIGLNKQLPHLNVNDIVAVDIPNQYNKKQKSRYLKTNLRLLVKGDYLFIDTDTIITGNLEEIDNFPFNIGAVLDTHLSIHDHLFRDDIRKFSDLYKWPIDYDKYFNSGVMYVRDNEITKEFYRKWNYYWHLGSKKFSVNIDQPSLAKADYESGNIITEMNGIYNCQVNVNGLKYFFEAKIIHYFASNIDSVNNSVLFANKKMYETIRDKGFSDAIIKMIKAPKTAIANKCTIIANKDAEIFRLPITRFAQKVAERMPRLNMLIRNLSIKRKIGK